MERRVIEKAEVMLTSRGEAEVLYLIPKMNLHGREEQFVADNSKKKKRKKKKTRGI